MKSKNLFLGLLLSLLSASPPAHAQLSPEVSGSQVGTNEIDGMEMMETGRATKELPAIQWNFNGIITWGA